MRSVDIKKCVCYLFSKLPLKIVNILSIIWINAQNTVNMCFVHNMENSPMPMVLDK